MKVIGEIWGKGFEGGFEGMEGVRLLKGMVREEGMERMMKECG